MRTFIHENARAVMSTLSLTFSAGLERAAASGVPDLHRVGPARIGQERAVRVAGHAVYPAGATLSPLSLTPRVHN